MSKNSSNYKDSSQNISNNEYKNTLESEQSFQTKDIHKQKSFSKFNSVEYMNQHPLLKSPPDIDLAYKHRQAKKVGKNQINSQEFCNCCNQPIVKQKFSLCTKTKVYVNEYQVGPNIYLYFEYMKYMLIIVLLAMAIMGNYQLVVQIIQCSQSDLCQNMSAFFQFDVKKYLDDKYQNTFYILNTITGGIILIACIFIRVQLQQQIEYYKLKTITAKSYSLKAINIPTNLEKLDLEVLFSGLLGRHVKVNDLVYAYKINSYVEAIRQKSKLFQEKQKAKQDYFKHLNREKLLKQEQIINEKQKELKKQIYKTKKIVQNQQTHKIKLNIAFITLEHEEDTVEIIQKWKLTFSQKVKKQLFCQKANLRLQEPPEPLDLIWENIEIPKKQKMQRRVIAILIVSTLQIVCFLSLFLVCQIQGIIRHDGYTKDLFLKLFLGFCCFGVVSFIQNGLSIVAKQFSNFQKHSCFTSCYSVCAFNMTWMFFVSSALIPFLLLVYQIYFNDQFEDNVNDLMMNVFFIFLGNATITPFVIFVNVWYYYRKFKMYRIKKQGVNCILNQFQANETFENPSFMVDWKYAKICAIQLTTVFYASMFPIGILLGILSLLANYWACKYDFIKKCSVPNNQSLKVHQKMIKYVCILPFVFSLGAICNEIFLKSNSHNIGHWISLAITALFFFFNESIMESQLIRKWILKKNFQKGHIKKHFPYSNVKQYFNIDYRSSNPITAIQQIVDNYTKMEKQDIQEQENQEEDLQQISLNKQISSDTQYLLGIHDEDILNNELFLKEQNLRQNLLTSDYYKVYNQNISNIKKQKSIEILQNSSQKFNKIQSLNLFEIVEQPKENNTELKSQDTEISNTNKNNEKTEKQNQIESNIQSMSSSYTSQNQIQIKDILDYNSNKQQNQENTNQTENQNQNQNEFQMVNDEQQFGLSLNLQKQVSFVKNREYQNMKRVSQDLESNQKTDIKQLKNYAIHQPKILNKSYSKDVFSYQRNNDQLTKYTNQRNFLEKKNIEGYYEYDKEYQQQRKFDYDQNEIITIINSNKTLKNIAQQNKVFQKKFQQNVQQKNNVGQNIQDNSIINQKLSSDISFNNSDRNLDKSQQKNLIFSQIQINETNQDLNVENKQKLLRSSKKLDTK